MGFQQPGFSAVLCYTYLQNWVQSLFHLWMPSFRRYVEKVVIERRIVPNRYRKSLLIIEKDLGTHRNSNMLEIGFPNLWIFSKSYFQSEYITWGGFMRLLRAYFQIMRNVVLLHLSLSCFCLLSPLTILQTGNEESRNLKWSCLNSYSYLHTDMKTSEGWQLRRAFHLQKYCTHLWVLLYLAQQLYLFKER